MIDKSKGKGVSEALADEAMNRLSLRAAAAYLAEYFSAREISATESDDSVKGSNAVDSAAPLHREQTKRSR
jgi:hypothetical protein